MEAGFGWGNGGEGNNNWDLYVVVRRGSGGGGGAAVVPPPNDNPFFALPPPQQQGDMLPDANMWQWQQAMDMPAMADPAANLWQQQAMDMPPAMADPAFAGVDEDFLAQILFPTPQPLPPPPVFLSANEVPPQQQAPKAVDKPESSNAARSSRPKQTRSKKNMEINAVMTVTDDDLAVTDVWAWRKYGQKPIKGNIYPRGYYRCSTNKACKARRHVERCAADPAKLLLVTYTGEHDHPVPRRKAGAPSHAQRRAAAAAAGSSRQAQQAAPPAPPPRFVYSNEFEAEEDDDAVALKCLIDDAVMAPENAYLFHDAPGYFNGGGGGDNSLVFPPVPDEMAVGTSYGGRAPIPNVVMDTFFVDSSPAAGWRGM
ncbi:hypothetical protein QOZ80_6BG0484250 [Eleusine coracana subsp. coracana]|nr:hypothetical protein QOZ80_6BG0484250 [Eleusine coracana subsp. coracana]